MIRVIGLLLIVLICFNIVLSAQTISSNSFREMMRNNQLLGIIDKNISLTVNPNQIKSFELDTLLPISKSIENLNTKNNYAQFKIVPLTITQQFNSELPYDWNQSSAIPSKGYQVQMNTGIFAKLGNHFQFQFAPEFSVAQNPYFETFSNQLSAQTWSDHYQFINTSDLPERFGDQPYKKTSWGQSFIKYNTKKISFGISSENLWWGPGYRNALIMSNNAQGFAHITVNTIQPFNTSVGSFEAQIIGGLLTNSGILPPRIFSAFNGNYVYIPKDESVRYLTGMIITWQPKWTPGLFIGLAKASYLYAKDAQSPFDFLPFQGFLGKSITQAEKADKKASLGSMFVRYILPEEHAEVYIEYGRKDQALLPGNIIEKEPYRRAYTAGIRKLLATHKNNSYIQFGLEFTQMQAPTPELIRSPDSWYTHQYVRQGYTNNGKSIGAGIGPGSNSQTIEIAWIKGFNRVGLQFERLIHNSDFYYFSFERLGDFRRHWVDVSASLKADWTIKHFYLSLNASFIRTLNHQWVVVQIDPRDYFTPSNDYFSINSSLSVVYRF